MAHAASCPHFETRFPWECGCQSSALHPIFAHVLDSHARVTEAVAPKADTHRGWLISFDYPPIPCRNFDWSATHPDYDGADDANDNRHVAASTREGVMAEIDAWYAENEA